MDEIVQFDFPTDSPKIIKVIGVGGGRLCAGGGVDKFCRAVGRDGTEGCAQRLGIVGA